MTDFTIFEIPSPASYNLERLKEQAEALDGFFSIGIVNEGDVLEERLRFSFTDPTATTAADVQHLVDNHDPAELSSAQKAHIVRNEGAAAFAALPGWATWTVQEAEDHIETSVTDLASAKVVLKALAKAIVALRNDRWPGLQGG